MTLHQMTKADRQQIAKRSEEILDKDPCLTLKNIGARLGVTAQHLSSIRREFGCQRLKEIKGGRDN